MKSMTKLTYAKLNDFVEDCTDEIYPKHYRSEDRPSADLYRNMKTLVGMTIEPEVFTEKDLYYLVFVYNQRTVSALPKFQHLAEKFENEKVRFYIFDSDKNENRNVRPSHEGKIILFQRKQKLMKTFTLDKSLSLKGIREFMQKSLRKDRELLETLQNSQWMTDL